MSKPNLVRSLSIVVLLAIVACTVTPVVEVPERDVSRAQEALTPFKEELKNALIAGLEEGGPQAAIMVCRAQAPEIAAALSGDGIEMGRTSHRLRNPDNAPRAWMEPLLEEYLQESLSPYLAVRIDEATVGYVEPIFVDARCLSCHGPAVEESLLAEIHTHYPNDAATGFKAGELRGLFWVEVASDSGAAG